MEESIVDLKTIAVGVVALSLLFVSCTGKTEPAKPAEAPSANQVPVYRKISVQEAKRMMEASAGVVIVDVRTLEEFAQGHIANAILIPNETIGTSQKPAQLPDVNAVVLVYCRSGNRSQQAAKKLVALGYTKVYDFGGIIDWPFETVR